MKVKKAIFFFLFSLMSLSSISQNRMWLSGDVECNIWDKKIRLGTGLNFRFYDTPQLDKIFPELSVRYKVTSWLKPSVDYRYVINNSITSKNLEAASRFNFNINTYFEVDRFDLDFRVRYQYKFDGTGSGGDYEPDFDNALRFKPKVKYDIKGSRFQPRMELEWFYNTNQGKEGRQFTKFRFALGVDVKIDKNSELSVRYRYDYEFNLANPWRAHILSLSYLFGFKYKKKSEL